MRLRLSQLHGIIMKPAFKEKSTILRSAYLPLYQNVGSRLLQQLYYLIQKLLYDDDLLKVKTFDEIVNTNF